ncbi:MAG: FecR domain-containing protein [Sphingomonadales bacterium]|nr:FecR domain-containing protein [Sphingomonadales bacterium]
MLREALTQDRLRAMEPDEAAAYFVACGIDGLTASEQELLDDWLAESVDHSAALDRANRGWDSFADADGDEILSAMRAHALAPPAAKRRPWPRFAAAAAVLLLVAMASILLLPRLGRAPRPDGGAATTVEYASTPTGIRNVVLPDGSRMTLDANSVVRGRFAATSRALAMVFAATSRALAMVRGRAFFDVRHDSSRPFAVTANGRRIVDLGTRFDVSVIGGSLRVRLEQGSVAIESPGSNAPTVTLRPGQEFVAGEGRTAVNTVATAGSLTDWRRGLVDFEDTPLAAAVAQINRYSTAQIVVRDAQVSNIRVSGQFRTGDAERFARTIAELHPVRVVRKGDKIEIVPAK